MGNLINLPNISLNSLVLEGNKAQEKKNGVFDAKNYLNTRLADGEDEKTITIRLLPMDLETGNPFVVVHTHNVKVPNTMVKPGEKPYKSYICLAKNADINHEKFGTKCPFCELNRAAYNESTKATDPQQKKSYQEISLANLSREAIICRCIERGKEDEGVKFWKFNLRADKTDPYNQIVKLANLRREEAERKGKVNNILDIYDGRDLNITFTAAPMWCWAWCCPVWGCGGRWWSSPGRALPCRCWALDTPWRRGSKPPCRSRGCWGPLPAG